MLQQLLRVCELSYSLSAVGVFRERLQGAVERTIAVDWHAQADVAVVVDQHGYCGLKLEWCPAEVLLAGLV
jgi:hypothetical protein